MDTRMVIIKMMIDQAWQHTRGQGRNIGMRLRLSELQSETLSQKTDNNITNINDDDNNVMENK